MTQFLEPQFLIQAAGLAGIFAIVFAESGLFFGFFFPGDSLLVAAGLFAAQGNFNIFLLTAGAFVAAVLGDSVGYAFGRKVGPKLFKREDSLLFHKKHVERAQAFYEKHGVKTIVLARFVPIVRTFAPIVAGVGQMKYRTFIAYNVIGGFWWTVIMTLTGFFLGKAFPGIVSYIHYVVGAIILLSLVPIALEWAKARKARTMRTDAPAD